MTTLLQDLRYGFRMLLKNPIFTVVAVVTLALGIGANSAIFSVVNTILLRPLAYKDPDRLVLINHNYPKLDLKASVSAPGYAHYRDNAQSFSSVAALTGWNVNLTGEGEPERLQGTAVTANLFSTLGAEAARGRVFLTEEDQPGRNRVVVLSDQFWQRRFGGSPDLIDKTITLNGESYTVVGIMPPSFQFGREIGQIVDLWSPIAFTPDQLATTNLTNEYLSVIARLKPNVSFGQAQAELDAIATNLRQQYMPGMDSSGWNLALQYMNELVVGDIRPALLVLLGAVGFVLLIACANVANLLLARSAAREKEFAIRAALGAGRWRTIRQLLTESVLLALIGGGLGLLLATWGVEVLMAINEGKIPRAHEIGLDANVLTFTLVVTLLTGIIFGLAPALQVSKNNLHDTLKEGGRSGSAGTRRSVRNLLVVTEMALAVVLLVGAGLLIRSSLGLQQVNPGFQPQNVLAMQLSLPDYKYREPPQRDVFYRQLMDGIRALPGVKAAGAISVLPMSGQDSSGSFRIEGRDVLQGQTLPHGARWAATSDYFKTMSVPLIKGRYFTERDGADAPGVAIIDETMARKYWPDEDPVGRRITFEGTPENRRWREIVGVVGHVKHKSLEGESRVQYYIPHPQRPSPNMFLVVQGTTEPASLTTTVRATIKTLDKDLPVYKVTTMERLVTDSMAQRRFAMVLFGIFATVALVLAAVGLFGVIAYTVTQRTHEIGLRIALGAQPSDVLRLVLGQGMLLALIGVGIGLVAALALTRLMTSLLYGVSATDPVTFIGIAPLLVAVAMLACYVPARKAMRTDPMVALRYE
ncbi:MAG: ABC transporter permease [Acidobacteriota bacterium]|nr:ABC transporter permease [Acidobacteriota bacterium]